MFKRKMDTDFSLNIFLTFNFKFMDCVMTATPPMTLACA